MFTFLIRRLNLFFFTMLLLLFIAFELNFLFPGNTLSNFSGIINLSPEEQAFFSQLYRQEGNIFEQFWAYLGQVFQGNLGVSMTTGREISQEIFNYLPPTIELTIVALLTATIIGVPLGFIAALNHNKLIDRVILSISLLGHSMPVFWLGMLVITLFSITLSWLPSSGQINLLFEIPQVTGFMFVDIAISDIPYKWDAFKSAYYHIILPSFVVAAAPATVVIRLARTAMIDVVNTNYIKAAKAKGLSNLQIIYHHAIRNALLIIVRNIGLQFANLITIAMITEVIFDWPGIGRWLIEAIYQRDYTAIHAGLLILSSFIFLVNIIIDLIYALLNPLSRGHYGTR